MDVDAQLNIVSLAARGRCIGDDGPEPEISIDDAQVQEGDAGEHEAELTVTLSNPSAQAITTRFAASDVSAKVGEDYVATSGTVTFPAGEETAIVRVPILGDATTEPDETLAVTLTAPEHGVLGDDVATLTILDDDPPHTLAARDDEAATVEDTPLLIPGADLLSNDADSENHALLVSGVRATSDTRGRVALLGGAVAYQPQNDFAGMDAFEYDVTDGHGARATATVRVTIAPVNDPPAITSTPVTEVVDGHDYRYDVHALDVDDGDRLAFSLPQAPAGMTIDPGSGVITWAASAAGSAAALGEAATGLGPATIANFDDVDASPLTGTYLGRTPLGSGHYASKGIYLSNGTADPLIVAPGGLGWNLTNSLSIAHFPLDPAPRPARDEDDDLTIDLNPGCAAAGFAIVDGAFADGEYVDFLDARGELIERLSLSGSFVGLASVARSIARIEISENDGDGDDTNYDDITCFRGATADVTVRVEDVAGATDAQSFTVHVAPDGHAPLAVDDDLGSVAGYELVESVRVPVDGSSVLSQSVLRDGVDYRLHARGTFVIGGPGYADAEYAFTSAYDWVIDGCFDVAPDLGIGVDDHVIDELKQPRWGPFNPAHTYSVGFTGRDGPISLDYHDCGYGDNSGELTVDIFGPIPGLEAREDTAVTRSAHALLANDIDADGDDLTLAEALATAGTHGTIALEDDGVAFTPEPDFNGPVTFLYRASDGAHRSNVAAVQMTLRPVNDAPTATADELSTAGEQLTVGTAALTANDRAGPVNEGDQALAVVAVAPLPATSGTVGLFAGNVVYVPPAGFVGTDSFAYTVCDDGITAGVPDPLCAQGTVSVRVDAPAIDCTSKPVFLGATGATSATGPLPLRGPVGRDATVGGVTLSTTHQLHLGRLAGEDWTLLAPGARPRDRRS